MPKISFLLLVACLCQAPVFAQKKWDSPHFFQNALLGASFGGVYDWEEFSDKRRAITESTVSLRGGVSLTRRLLAGLQTRVIWAGVTDLPTERFYMLGPYLRYDFLPGGFDDNFRLNAEAGFYTGNYYTPDTDYFTNAENRPDQTYLNATGTVEWQFFPGLWLEVGVAFHHGLGWPAGRQGINYPTVGVNWQLGNP
ncbi:MAG: hypothetical protein ACK4Q5_08295 [Saprospiraceae bacterium]